MGEDHGEGCCEGTYSYWIMVESAIIGLGKTRHHSQTHEFIAGRSLLGSLLKPCA